MRNLEGYSHDRTLMGILVYYNYHCFCSAPITEICCGIMTFQERKEEDKCLKEEMTQGERIINQKTIKIK